MSLEKADNMHPETGSDNRANVSSVDELMESIDNVSAANDVDSHDETAPMLELPEDLEDEIADLLDSDFSADLDDDVESLLEAVGDDDSMADLNELASAVDDVEGDSSDVVDVLDEMDDDLQLLDSGNETFAAHDLDTPAIEPEPAPASDFEHVVQSSAESTQPELKKPLFASASRPDSAPTAETEAPIEVPELLVPGSGGKSATGSMTGFIGVVVGLVALSFGAIAIWAVNSMNTEMEQMRQSVLELSAQVEGLTAREQSSDLQDALQSVRLVNERLNDLGAQTQELSDELASVSEQVERDSDLLQVAFGRMKGMENRLDSVKGKVAAAPQPTQAKPKAEEKPEPIVRPTPEPAAAPGWVVNLGTFNDRAQAEKLRTDLKGKGVPALIGPFEKQNGTLYRVQVGGFASYDAAKASAEMLRSKHGLKGAWVGKSG